jgi:hypothetical protein
MKTREVLIVSEAELSSALKIMKVKELDRHVEKILSRLGVDDYKAVISSTIKALPGIEPSRAGGYQQVQNIVLQAIPAQYRDKLVPGDILARIAIMIVVLITKQFEKIHRESR